MFRSSVVVRWGEFQTRGAGQRVQNSAVQMQCVVVECCNYLTYVIATVDATGAVHVGKKVVPRLTKFLTNYKR